jgi:hypothetical protein
MMLVERMNTCGKMSQDAIIQSNPKIILDRPAGLYGSKQMVLQIGLLWSFSRSVQPIIRGYRSIFTHQESDWQFMDAKCQLYSIDFIVINDVDPLWKNIQTLASARKPFYQNDRYIIFSCGDSAS